MGKCIGYVLDCAAVNLVNYNSQNPLPCVFLVGTAQNRNLSEIGGRSEAATIIFRRSLVRWWRTDSEVFGRPQLVIIFLHSAFRSSSQLLALRPTAAPGKPPEVWIQTPQRKESPKNLSMSSPFVVPLQGLDSAWSLIFLCSSNLSTHFSATDKLSNDSSFDPSSLLPDFHFLTSLVSLTFV